MSPGKQQHLTPMGADLSPGKSVEPRIPLVIFSFEPSAQANAFLLELNLHIRNSNNAHLKSVLGPACVPREFAEGSHEKPIPPRLADYYEPHM